MTPRIKNLLKSGKWPIGDAITFADGSMVVLQHQRSLDHTSNVLTPAERTNLDRFFESSPDMLTNIYGSFELEVGEYLVQCGETSWGSEGWVALQKDGKFQWLACFGDSNPFKSAEIDIENGKLQVLSTHNCLWSFDLEKPWEIRVEDKNPLRTS